MDQNDTLANAATEAADTTTQAEKTFSQTELNAILAKTKAQYEKKYASRYEELGDPDELRNIVDNYRKQQQELEIKRGNFDKIMADLASSKDAEIAKRDEVIRQYKIEQPLLNLAAKYKSVNPEQVSLLLKNKLKLNEEGEVEVLDDKGQVRYNKNGKPYDVDTYVKEFLDANPHFVSAAPATTNTQGNVGNKVAGEEFDLSKLDMTRPDHRKLYAEARRQGRL